MLSDLAFGGTVTAINAVGTWSMPKGIQNDDIGT